MGDTVNTLLKTLLIAAPLACLVGCASAKPQVVTVYETVSLYKDRYIRVPASLTRAVDTVALSEKFDVYELGAVAKAREIRLMQCNGQLAEIAALGKVNTTDRSNTQ